MSLTEIRGLCIPVWVNCPTDIGITICCTWKLSSSEKRTHCQVPRPKKSKANDKEKLNQVAGIQQSLGRANHTSYLEFYLFLFLHLFLVFFFLVFTIFSNYWGITCSVSKIYTCSEQSTKGKTVPQVTSQEQEGRPIASHSVIEDMKSDVPVACHHSLW